MLRVDLDAAENDGGWALGKFAEKSWYDRTYEGDFEMRREDGTLLAKVMPGAIARDAGARMFRALVDKISKSENRGLASGGERILRLRADGSRGRTRVSTIHVHSSIIGYFDRYARIPYCRETAFLEQYPERYRSCLPAIQQADAAFAAGHPEAYARQRAIAAQTSRDFLIAGTCFTTLTLNRNFQTAGHRDAGDLPEGFGVMTYYEQGHFGGGHLVFPAYRVALRLRSFDVLLFDPHEVHCNTAIVALRKTPYKRMTCVHYYRKNMVYCGDAAEERRIAAAHDPRRAARNLRQQGKINI